MSALALVDRRAFLDFELADFAVVPDFAAVVDDGAAADLADLWLAFLAAAVESGFF